MRAALPSYVKGCGVLCCRVGGRPDDPCSDPAIMAYLVPEQWRFEGRRQRMAMMSSDGLEGAADVGPYGVQE
jgi:hypothetical protein